MQGTLQQCVPTAGQGRGWTASPHHPNVLQVSHRSSKWARHTDPSDTHRLEGEDVAAFQNGTANCCSSFKKRADSSKERGVGGKPCRPNQRGSTLLTACTDGGGHREGFRGA